MNTKYKAKIEKPSLKADLNGHKWKDSVGCICGGVIVWWAGKYECMQHNRILSDIVFKGNQRPPASTLDQFRNGTSFSHSSCTTSTQRLACNICPKIVMKTFNEPGMQGNGPIRFEPKLWVEREKCIMWFCVMLHDQLGVGHIRKSVNNNPISFKGGVGLVCWQPKWVLLLATFEQRSQWLFSSCGG